MAERHSRRAILGGAAGIAAMGLMPFGEWFDRYGRAEAAGPFVRYSVATPTGAAMLATYRNAVGTMMSRGLGEPCGWTFQWYTHQIQSDLNKTTVINGLPAPQRPLATDMWNTCQAHNGRPLQYFLPWHRMYVYFLERIIRQTSGVADFTLPYWNYMDPPQRPLPAPFRTDSASALYRVNRNDGSPGTANVNGGQPIDQGQPAGVINLDCMNQGNYQPSGSGSGFCSAINQNPHGIVHSLIGNSFGMGNVPWAANDPIFWLHHCNIDRLWATWNKSHPNPTESSWRDQQFVFADENCNRVLVTVRDFEAIAPLNYTYDTLPVFNPSLLERLKHLRLIAVIRRPPRPDPGPLRIALGSQPVVLPLTPAEGSAALTSTLRVNAKQRLRLRVTDLHADAVPGVLYHFYANLPKGRSLKAAQPFYLGSITFFDAVMSGQMDHGAMAMGKGAMGKGEGPSFEFDVTAPLARLGNVKALSISIVPAGPPAKGSSPSIGDVQLLVAE